MSSVSILQKTVFGNNCVILRQRRIIRCFGYSILHSTPLPGFYRRRWFQTHCGTGPGEYDPAACTYTAGAIRFWGYAVVTEPGAGIRNTDAVSVISAAGRSLTPVAISCTACGTEYK